MLIKTYKWNPFVNNPKFSMGFFMNVKVIFSVAFTVTVLEEIFLFCI